MPKLFDVYVSQTFSSYVVIEAESAEEAENIACEQLQRGEIDPLNWDGDVFIDSAEEIKNA